MGGGGGVGVGVVTYTGCGPPTCQEAALFAVCGSETLETALAPTANEPPEARASVSVIWRVPPTSIVPSEQVSSGTCTVHRPPPSIAIQPETWSSGGSVTVTTVPSAGSGPAFVTVTV